MFKSLKSYKMTNLMFSVYMYIYVAYRLSFQSGYLCETTDTLVRDRRWRKNLDGIYYRYLEVYRSIWFFNISCEKGGTTVVCTYTFISESL